MSSWKPTCCPSLLANKTTCLTEGLLSIQAIPCDARDLSSEPFCNVKCSNTFAHPTSLLLNSKLLDLAKRLLTINSLAVNTQIQIAEHTQVTQVLWINYDPLQYYEIYAHSLLQAVLRNDVSHKLMIFKCKENSRNLILTM